MESSKNSKKRIYFYFFLLTLFSIVAVVYTVFYKILFSPVYNVLFGIATVVLFLLISNRSYLLFKETSDKRMAILSMSFLWGSIFEILHFSNTAYVNPEFAYKYAEIFTIMLGFFILIINCQNPIVKDTAKFFKKTSLIYFLVAVIATLILIFNAEYLGIMAMSLPLGPIQSALYFLFAFVFVDMRLNQKLPIFTPFILGIILLGSSDIIDPSFYYNYSHYRFLSHFIDIFGYSLIFIDLKNILLKTDYFSIKDKMLLYNGLLISSLYLATITYFSFVLDFDFRNAFNYMFFVIFLIMLVSFYFLTMKITAPIANIIEGMIKNKPGQEPHHVAIISNDEIGSLTEEFNKNAELVYNYSIKEKQNFEREKLLREIIEKIRSSLDIEETLYFICEETAKLFNVQRTAITMFPDKNNFENFEFRKEYKTNPDILSFLQARDYSKITTVWGETLIGEKKSLAVDNLEASDLPDYFRNSYTEIGVKSLMGTAIKKGTDVWGTLVLSEYETPRTWTEEEKTLLEAIANQVYIAIYQAEFYKKEKQSAEREHLLREIIEKIRSSLSLEDTLTFICEETAKLFKVQRSIIVEYPESNNFAVFIPRKEFKASPDIKSFKTVEEISKISEYWGKMVSKTEESFFVENIDESNAPDYFKAYYKSIDVKSIIGTKIGTLSKIWGGLILSEYNTYRHWTEEEKELLKAISNQIYIAIKQAELYEKEKLSAERERVSRNIIEILRSSIEKPIIKKMFVKNIGKLLNADRVFFSDYDKKSNFYMPVDVNSEYLSDLKEKSFIGFDWATPNTQGRIQPLLEKREIKIYNLEEYVKQALSVNKNLILHYLEYNIKSTYSFPVVYQDKIMGYFCIEFTKEARKLSDEEINRVRNICSQAGIGLYQAELYNKAQEALKERSGFIADVAVGSKKILENIIELSEKMKKNEPACENHIRHINHVDANIRLLLNLTNRLIEKID